MSKSLSNQRIWITGASSGIGESLAAELIRRGNTVVVSARRTEALQDLAAVNKDNVLVVQMDVTDKQSVANAGQQIQEKLGALDLVIMNAGTCEYVDTRNFDSDMVQRVMDVNLMGLVRCTEAALPLLRKGKHPHLVGMSSTVARAPLPRAEAYGTSKAAVRYFLESLRADLTPEGIDVSVIYPGFVKTPLTDQNDFPMPMLVSVEDSTRHIISGILKRKASIYYPFVFSVLIRLLGSLPTSIRNRLCQRMVQS